MDSALREIMKEERKRKMEKEREREKERGKDRDGDRDRGDKKERKERPGREERTDKSGREERTDKSGREERRPDRPDREERRPDKSDREERRSDKDKDNREKYKHRENKVENHTKQEDDKERFMFIYEDKDGKLYSDLNSVPKEGEIKIFPVYVNGWNDNLIEEIVTFENGRWSPSEENKDTTWLSVIDSRDPKILTVPFDLDDVVVYNGRFFHCEDDLLDYIQENGGEYLSVSK